MNNLTQLLKLSFTYPRCQSFPNKLQLSNETLKIVTCSETKNLLKEMGS